jgi:uncharacterized membrane protein YvlD (DUF360 family)
MSKSLLLTLLILLVLEVVNTSLMPILGFSHYNLAFNVLIVLFIGFRVESSYQALYIFVIQYFHSFFTVEGWETGTIAGILICVIISYMKEILHFINFLTTIFVTYIFQMVWFVVVAGLMYLKTQNIDYISDKFWRFVIEGLIMSVLAPWFFMLLQRIWKVEEEGSLKKSF